MKRIANLILILAISTLGSLNFVQAKNSGSVKNADPTCPIDMYGKPDKLCSRKSPELIDVKCPAGLEEIDCDYYVRGFREANEDKIIMGELYKRDWKSDEGDTPAFKRGYEEGWRFRGKQ